MTARRRLSICYAAPGQNLVPWAGPTRNVLSVAETLSQWADVTVAFRKVLCPITMSTYRVIPIETQPGRPALADDNATRGLHPLQHLSYCRELWSFARQQAGSFDVVLEKGWRLSGLLSVAFQRAGVPAMVVENDIRFWTEPLDSLRQISKYMLHGTSHFVAGECSRRVRGVIAETDELKAMLVSRRRVPPDRIHVIGLGVDHRLFRPMEQASARESLGVNPDAFVLLYVGGMDEYHDLEPVIDALARAPSSVAFHVVGDGEYRPRYEERAKRAGLDCRFYGRIPHASVPHYIAAADLCIAPYRTDAFRDGLVTFSTLKVPEYMACARPVVSVPSAGIGRVVVNGVSGFLFPNTAMSWSAFFEGLPSRQRLASMGTAAARAVETITWDRTAARYLEACERLVSFDTGYRVPRIANPAGLGR